jgi:hypothetical protein
MRQAFVGGNGHTFGHTSQTIEQPSALNS